MPNLDGLESTRLIRQMGYSAPIVALTAFADEINIKQCMDSGMDMFLSKPIRRPALKQVLQKFATIEEEVETSPSSPDKDKDKAKATSAPDTLQRNPISSGTTSKTSTLVCADGLGEKEKGKEKSPPSQPNTKPLITTSASNN